MRSVRRKSAVVRGLGVCAAALVCVMLFSRCCFAPVLFLRDGRKMAGVCRLSGRQVALSRGLTTTYIPRASIERVELHPKEEQEFQRLRDVQERAGASGQYRLGKWLDDHLQFDAAADHYTRAIEIESNHVRARQALGYRREGSGWVDDPAKQLERAAKGFGRNAADACVKLGKTYAGKENTAAAEKAFRRALVADPYHTEALTLIQPYIAAYKPKNAYRKPLDGRTAAVSGHNHRTVAFMVHAVDLAKLDDAGRTFSGDARKLESYHTFDAPVRAAAAGVVFYVEDRFEDVPIGRPGDFLQANRVCIRHPGGEFTLYAHLKKDSVVVKKGQYVKAGEPLGTVGNSGSSWTPHLHFCLYDGDGISLPVTFVDAGSAPEK